MTYPGGKGRCYQHLISLMPPHRAYIETNLGHGAVMRRKKPAIENVGFDLDPDVLAWWRSRTPPGYEVKLGDGIAHIRERVFSGDELVYCDPPYLAATRRSRTRLYKHDWNEAQHIDALTLLSKLPCAVIVSGYASNLYDDMLTGWTRVEMDGWSQAGRVVETVWMNFVPGPALHDYQHLGATFREREQIRRRRQGIVRRISALSAQERLAMLEVLASMDPTGYAAIARSVTP